MKSKFILSLFILIASIGYRSQAQCPQPPIYLNASHFNSSGWTFAFTIPQPVCDSILGWQVQWKIQGTSTWSEIRADSLKQVNSTGLWGGRIETSLTTGSKYQWRTRMIMYKPNGKAAYSSWAGGTSFTPFDPVLPYNTPPDELEMFLPGSTDILFIISDNPEAGWNIPTKYQLQYRPIGTSVWEEVSGPTPDPPPGAIAPYLSDLTPSTPYEWRVRYKCGAGNNSAWVNGPDFTTASASAPEQKQKITRQFLYFKSSQITYQADETNFATSDKITGNEILVYPNPAVSQLHIRLGNNVDNVIITLKDLSGKTVYINTKKSSDIAGIDVSKLQSGIYVLQVTGTDNKIITTQKIIVSH